MNEPIQTIEQAVQDIMCKRLKRADVDLDASFIDLGMPLDAFGKILKDIGDTFNMQRVSLNGFSLERGTDLVDLVKYHREQA